MQFNIEPSSANASEVHIDTYKDERMYRMNNKAKW